MMYGFWFWFLPFWPLSILVWIAIFGLACWLLFRTLGWGRGTWTQAEGGQRAREILAERYARGEITTEEYRDRLNQIG
jgi:putative membrane protein